MSVRHPQSLLWLALGLLLLLPASANAMLPKKPDQKCIISINRGAAKVAKAQDGDNNACVKDYGKEKNGSAAACVTSDPRGKVAEAISEIKTGDCVGVPAGLFGLDIDSASIGATMTAKSLALLADLFGSDLDGAVVLASADKPGSRCQTAVLKAAGKCQVTKLKEFARCQRKGLRAGSVDSACELKAACMTLRGLKDPVPLF